MALHCLLVSASFEMKKGSLITLLLTVRYSSLSLLILSLSLSFCHFCLTSRLNGGMIVGGCFPAGSRCLQRDYSLVHLVTASTEKKKPELECLWLVCSIDLLAADLPY